MCSSDLPNPQEPPTHGNPRVYTLISQIKRIRNSLSPGNSNPHPHYSLWRGHYFRSMGNSSAAAPAPSLIYVRVNIAAARNPGAREAEYSFYIVSSSFAAQRCNSLRGSTATTCARIHTHRRVDFNELRRRMLH